MFLQEPECLDQWHADEQVSWIAVEAGAWVNNEGTGGFQAGTAAAEIQIAFAECYAPHFANLLNYCYFGILGRPE